MYDCRGLHTDTHMRTLSIVEPDYALQDVPALIPRRYSHLVQPFNLENAVCPLRYRVFKRIAALCHTDAYPSFLQFRHIFIAAILTATVRMMDQLFRCSIIYCRQRHSQCLQRVYCFQCGAYGPTYNLVRISVRYERQIAYSLSGLHVCYVAYPYLVRTGRENIRNEIGILAVVMTGVCRFIVPASLQPDHKAVFAEQLYERVTPGHIIFLVKQPLHYQIQLRTSQTGIGLAVFAHFLHDEWLYGVGGELMIVPFVIGLPAVTKQPAESAQSIFRTFPA